jgi:uncharacterized RDD family membrane protein YckC
MVYGGLKSRLIAFGYDYLVISGFIFIVAVLGSFLAFGPYQEWIAQRLSSPILREALAFTMLVLPVILYFGFQEASPGQGTWGKRRKGLRVQTLDGTRLGFGRALLRSMVKFLPWQIAHTCLFNIPGWPVAPEEPPAWVLWGFGLVWGLVGVNFGMLIWSKTHRTLYDWAAGTAVVATTQSA